MKNRFLFIYIAFGLSFIVIITISLLLLQKFSTIRRGNLLVEHTYEVKNQILKVQANLIEAENNLRGFFFLPKDTALFRPVSQTQKNVFKEIELLKQLTKDNPNQQQLIKKLKPAVSSWYQIIYGTIEDAENSENSHFTANSKKGNQMLQQVMYLSDKMDKEESNLLKKRREDKSVLEIAAPMYLRVILLISCFFQLVSFIIIIKAFKRRQIHQKILENKIKELDATNTELEQIAFVASHDLQEPLRKIRTFSDKLIVKYKSNLNEEGKMIVEKISFSSKRMQELLNDLINYTYVTKNEEEVKQVDLRRCFDEACKELSDVIKVKSATIKVSELPIVSGQYKQLYVLFYNLLDNALKFSKPDISPVITLAALEVPGTEVNSSNMFIRITFSDNGIGFEKEYNKKIFIIFKRLHPVNSSITGKGIGLAICKKVMINHNGYITAKGEAGIGAELTLYFPANTIETV